MYACGCAKIEDGMRRVMKGNVYILFRGIVLMADYFAMNHDELTAEKTALEAQYKKFQGMNLKLNMARGKPGPHQMDLAMDLLKMDNYITDNGFDTRNYGELEGLPEARALFADVFGVQPGEVFVGGNSSLQLMYNLVAIGMMFGFQDSPKPWGQVEHRKFLCPVPGYDRHFAITEEMGFELISVPMSPDGPDMDMIEKLVAEDDTIKGIWCVPLYSNPDGYSYSDETVRRLAAMETAAPDFKIMWDNAYCVHHLYDINQDHLIEILKECKRAGNPDMVYKFCSTSKITFPGSGVAAIATSANNLEDIKKQLKIQTIGHDKVNQLRHVRFFKDIHGITEHMRKHADSLRPKFEMILDTFERELKGLGAGSWYSPKGGYFITYETLDGCAKNVVAKAKKAGVVMTPAGAPFPYGKDPHDSVIRISPSYPSLEDLTTAIDIFVVCVKLASIEKLLGE